MSRGFSHLDYAENLLAFPVSKESTVIQSLPNSSADIESIMNVALRTKKKIESNLKFVNVLFLF